MERKCDFGKENEKKLIFYKNFFEKCCVFQRIVVPL